MVITLSDYCTKDNLISLCSKLDLDLERGTHFHDEVILQKTVFLGRYRRIYARTNGLRKQLQQ